jgi:spoIIIJ-associated protein
MKKHIQKTTENILEKLGVKSTTIVEETDEAFFINIESEDSALLIGRGGENLFSLEYIIKLIHQNNFKDERVLQKIVLDVSGYRKNQTKMLEQIATRAYEKVLKYKRPEVLRPMNAYERRIVHVALKNYEEIATESIGNDPYRRIIVKIK